MAQVFASIGVEKIRLTGGEPLLRNGLELLVEGLSNTQGIRDLTLTTNGYLLAPKARALKEAGLTRLTVSLDSLDDEVSKAMNGRGYGVGKVLEGIRACEKAGLSPIKINTVVQRGMNDHTIIDLARLFKGTGHIVRFIEYMDVGNLNSWKLDQVVSADEIVAMIDAQMPLEPVEGNYPGEVASRYRYVDGSGEIGVISSVTKPFCGDCTRARLSTEGKLYTCLFAGSGTDLRSPLRQGATDDELKDLLWEVWRQREDRYSELRTHFTSLESQPKKVEMYQIGG